MVCVASESTVQWSSRARLTCDQVQDCPAFLQVFAHVTVQWEEELQRKKERKKWEEEVRHIAPPRFRLSTAMRRTYSGYCCHHNVSITNLTIPRHQSL
eukprot:2683846-Amphidinium_carterae.1